MFSINHITWHTCHIIYSASGVDALITIPVKSISYHRLLSYKIIYFTSLKLATQHRILPLIQSASMSSAHKTGSFIPRLSSSMKIQKPYLSPQGNGICCCVQPDIRPLSTLTQQIKDTRPPGITSIDCLRVTQNRRNSVRALLSSVNDLVSAVFLDAIYYIYCGSFYHQLLVSNTTVVVAMLLKNTLPHSEMVYVCLLLCTA